MKSRRASSARSQRTKQPSKPAPNLLKPVQVIRRVYRSVLRPNPQLTRKHKRTDDLIVELSLVRIAQRLNPYGANPFTVLEVTHEADAYAGVPHQAKYLPFPLRDEAYHMGRIAWLIDNGWEDPIVIDWVWRSLTPFRPSILDGHHRFCAAVLTGDRSILVNYSGPINLIHELQ